MITFLYWNLNRRRDITDLIVALVDEHDVDLLILSECSIPVVELQLALNEGKPKKFGLPYNPIPDPDPLILTRFPSSTLTSVRDDKGATIRKFSPLLGPELLLVAVHFPSKLRRTEADLAALSQRVARIIEEEEEKRGHRRTLVVGDLNMNPFEPGVVGADTLHAVMTRERARRISRTVDGKQRFFFYNPMWSHFGEYPSGPPGTYHYSSFSYMGYFWNMFDQVLLRPELLDYFSDENLSCEHSCRICRPSSRRFGYTHHGRHTRFALRT